MPAPVGIYKSGDATPSLTATGAVLSLFVAIPAFADPSTPSTNISFYGIADVNMTGMDSGFGKKFSFGSGGFSSSRLGFKVTRDVGAGLQAVGLAEGGLLYDTGLLGNASVIPGINHSSASSGGQAGSGPQIFSRQAFAGLSGSFGAATIGRQHSPSYIATAFVGAAKGDGLLGHSTSLLPLIGGMPTRLNNSFLYVTPKVAGLSGSLMYTTGNENNVNTTAPVGVTSTNDKAGRGADAGIFYTQGSLNAALTTWRVKNASYATAGETELARKAGWQLAANYDSGVMRLHANYVDGKISGGT